MAAESPLPVGAGFCIYCVEADPTCVTTCYVADPYFPVPVPPPPPPPPPPPQTAEKLSQSHLAPFLIAAVCFLGVAFLLLTTCTVILRYRFTRRRRALPDGDGDGGGDGGGGVDHPIWHIATVGLQQSVIDSITAFKYGKFDGLLIEGSDCSVCLTEFEDGEELRLLPKCSHAFHVECIDTWLRAHKNCPLCRAPVVNEAILNATFSSRRLGSSNLDMIGDAQMENSDNRESSGRRLDDVLVNLPLEGVQFAETLKKNRNELRILSDLGDNYRFRNEEEDHQDGGDSHVRRAISFNSSAFLSRYRALVGDDECPPMGIEGSSSSSGVNLAVNEGKKIGFEKKGSNNKRGLSMSGLLMKTSSIDRSLQKGPVSMKRSSSSSNRFFSFRRTKSQASVLPL